MIVDLLLLFFFRSLSQLLQQLKRLICDLCRLYNLPQHPDVEMLDQPLPAGPINPERKVGLILEFNYISMVSLTTSYKKESRIGGTHSFEARRYSVGFESHF
jgi:hypothetical protein